MSGVGGPIATAPDERGEGCGFGERAAIASRVGRIVAQFQRETKDEMVPPSLVGARLVALSADVRAGLYGDFD